MREFEVAWHRNFVLGKKRLIVAMFQSPNLESDGISASLKQYISSHTYIDCSSKTFWDQLLYAMPIGKLGTNRNFDIFCIQCQPLKLLITLKWRSFESINVRTLYTLQPLNIYISSKLKTAFYISAIDRPSSMSIFKLMIFNMTLKIRFSHRRVCQL